MAMEGSGEVNETFEDSAEAPHVKRKESVSSPRSNNLSAMEPAGCFPSVDNEWHQNMSMLRSPGLATETLREKDLLRQMTSGSGYLQGSLECLNDANGMVEELTLKNFKYPHLTQACSSNIVVEQAEKGSWQNFYKLAGDPCDVLGQEAETSVSGMGVDNASFGNFWIPKHLSVNQVGVGDHNIFVNAVKGDIHGGLDNSPSRYSKGIRTKVLPSAGFPQFLVKSNLKGKGVAYRCPGSFGPSAVQQRRLQNVRVSEGSTRERQDVMQKSNAGPNELPTLYGGGGTLDVNPDDHKGINLRLWLKFSDYKRSKSERLQIFRQILEFVHVSHSEGLALQHLRPSYFMLVPSNRVKYTGSFISDKQGGYFDTPIDQDIVIHSKRKKYSDLNEETYGLLSSKYPKVDEFQTADCSLDLCETTGGTKNSVGGFLSSVYQEKPNFREDQQRCDFFGGGIFSPSSICSRPIHQISQLEEKWYASPEELSSSTCPYASNIYCLGALFFEIVCHFESWELRAAAMSDLRHRILPSSFLSESPKEAGFCLWLLHPEPSSRPKAREVLLSNLIRDSEKDMLDDQSLASLEEEEAEADLLFHFLLSVKEEKEKQAQKLTKDIDCLRNDVEEIDRRHISRIARLRISEDSIGNPGHVSDRTIPEGPLSSGMMSRSFTPSMNEARLMKNIEQLEHAYFSMRSEVEMRETSAAERTDKDVLRNKDRSHLVQKNEGEQFSVMDTDRLGAFFDGLCKYARYSRFEVRGSLRNGDILNSANVICSLSFDSDEQYFAAAGVSKKIKIFEYESLLNDAVDVHYPAIEMSSKSRLSCVCWNGYIKNYLASTDYDGIVQLWDATIGEAFTQYTEHQKRAWSVDFSPVDPTSLASGSDDYSVKLWKINERKSTSTIRSVANVCCVQFSADSANLLAFGSADYKIYCYDLRNVRVPWCTLVGHKKAVSYVRFLDSQTLVSASTDNTLKLWDLNKTNSSGFSTNSCSLTFGGHTNEKNFIGLSVADGYIACGSETNEVFAYYKSLPMPITSHKFGSVDPISGQETGDDNGQFVSSVCWRSKSNMVVAANSSGSIKLLQMV